MREVLVTPTPHIPPFCLSQMSPRPCLSVVLCTTQKPVFPLLSRCYFLHSYFFTLTQMVREKYAGVATPSSITRIILSLAVTPGQPTAGFLGWGLLTELNSGKRYQCSWEENVERRVKPNSTKIWYICGVDLVFLCRVSHLTPPIPSLVACFLSSTHP